MGAASDARSAGSADVPSVVRVRVKPGSSRNRVGGSYGDPPELIVAVTAPAVDGRATQAVLTALAQALGVARAQLCVVSGVTARSKVVRVSDPPADLSQRLAGLLG